MNGYLNSEQIEALYQELDRQCAELAREHGIVTAAQRNQIAARIMDAARNNPPPRQMMALGTPARTFT